MSPRLVLTGDDLESPERPLLVFDGECRFCRLWIERWRTVTGDAIDYVPSQEAATRFSSIPPEAFDRSVVLITPGREVFIGAEAVLRALSLSGHHRWMMSLYERFPGFAPVSERLYRLVASNRRIASRVTRALWGAEVTPPTFSVARCVFLRLLGIVYLIAFVSLWVQIHGLIGVDGVLPANAFLGAVHDHLGSEAYWRYPTLAWMGAGNRALHVLCAAGTAASVLLVLGIGPAPMLLLAWGLYLSLATIGQTFLHFQWDNLLLEAGFLAIFLAPLKWRCRIGCPRPPSRLAMAMGWWLVFRLMFASGVVKLSSGDPTWWNLTALSYHYETQPLPPWTAWYMHGLPAFAQKLSTLCMFAIEFIAPFFILGPRRVRHAGAAALALLQMAIAATGNYGFFNLLTTALLVLLVDDAFWPARLRVGIAPRRARPSTWLLAPVALLLFGLGLANLLDAFRASIDWPQTITSVRRQVAPFRSANSYGLFSVMTTSRPEIIVEGSHDGSVWLEYGFSYKPGDTSRRPAFVAPHMPRLDWQMWFAALGDHQRNPWFSSFLLRLLQGQRDVLRLMEHDPFDGDPPRYVRGVLYDYRFSDPESGDPPRDWWRRRRIRLYSPTYRLEDPDR